MTCNCNIFSEIASGGVLAGGAATLISTDRPTSGGVVCGGSSTIWTNAPWDGFSLVLHLQEEGDGTPGEYEDSSPFGRDSQGDDGDSVLTPVRDDGVGCLYSQAFSGRQWITTPAIEKPMTISAFIRFTEPPFRPLCIFGHGSSLLFGVTFTQQLTAEITTTADEPTIVVGSTRLAQDRWHHVAVVVDSSARLYVDGVLDGEETLNGTRTTHSGQNFVGRHDVGQRWQGWIQEVRIHNVAHSAAWLAAERANMCSGEFYLIG